MNLGSGYAWKPASVYEPFDPGFETTSGEEWYTSDYSRYEMGGFC